MCVRAHVCVSNGASPVCASLQPRTHYVLSRGGGEGEAERGKQRRTHAPLADPLPRRAAANLRNEVGASCRRRAALPPPRGSLRAFSGLGSDPARRSGGGQADRNTSCVCVCVGSHPFYISSTSEVRFPPMLKRHQKDTSVTACVSAETP